MLHINLLYFKNNIHNYTLITRYIEKNVSLYLLCDDYVSIIADGTSVSTFLCTRKLGPEEVSVSLIAHRSLMN